MNKIYNILKLKERRISLRKNQTSEEILLWSKIRLNKLGFKFRRQHSIGGYIADFYCPQRRLVIEIDGIKHFEKETKKYDKIRSKYFEGLQIKVLRFTNNEINNNLERVILKIKNNLNKYSYGKN